jgi:fibronectin type 3 domain-containing protein
MNPESADHIVTVENVTVETAGDDNYEVTVTGRDLNDIESITVTGEQAETFMEILYTAQRASSKAEWDGLPANVADLYDALVYVTYYVNAKAGDDAYEAERAELAEKDRWKVAAKDTHE